MKGKRYSCHLKEAIQKAYTDILKDISIGLKILFEMLLKVEV